MAFFLESIYDASKKATWATLIGFLVSTVLR